MGGEDRRLKEMKGLGRGGHKRGNTIKRKHNHGGRPANAGRIGSKREICQETKSTIGRKGKVLPLRSSMGGE